MNKITITKIGLANVSELQQIAKQTFLETFAETNTEENMQQYLNKHLNINQLTTELIHPDSEFYFAKMDEQVIGYLKLNFRQAQTEIKDNQTVEIERIYVLKEFQGKQIGQQLYHTALHIAQQMNATFLWLGVWEKNLKAINFYKKNGLIAFDKHNFKLGDDLQTDIMMKLQLKKD